MENTNKIEIIRNIWKEIYPTVSDNRLNDFINELKNLSMQNQSQFQDSWYKDAIVYSLYVDLFNNGFSGLEAKLGYLQELGVNCLWLLPILDSPMRDAGFDIRNYREIRKDLVKADKNISSDEVVTAFTKFIKEAHKHNIRVIFDIALNHTSEEHPWFVDSSSSEDAKYREYYIWNKDTEKYKETRLLFKGMCPSNWEKSDDWYFFHRFFEFQPDLNYKNPEVLLAMCSNLVYWFSLGLDGFRADAIPYLWKEDGTNCENLEQTHTIVKFFRAVLDYIRPDAFLLAEACQPPKEVVKYFGNDDECHAGYHFPLMPQIFISIAQQSKQPIITTLKTDITPDISPNCQWFIFLRLHDELTLEMVTQQERDIINNYYRRDIRWNFREGEGVSARLADLMEYKPDKIGLAYSIMLTLLGTPVVYYGDEFGKTNDESYYKEMIKMTGKNDTRFFVRGKIDWNKTNQELNNPESYTSKVHKIIKAQLNTRRKYKCFGRGSREWVNITTNDGKEAMEVLAYKRKYKNEKMLVINNLSDKEIQIKNPLIGLDYIEVLNQQLETDNSTMILKPYSYYWILLNNS